MGFLSKLFSKSSEKFMARGDELLADQRFFEARGQYEDGLQFHLSKGGEDSDSIAAAFASKIAESNTALAGLNINEAEFAIGRGATDKAIEHLELALTQTADRALRLKAEKLLSDLEKEIGENQGAGDEPAH